MAFRPFTVLLLAVAAAICAAEDASQRQFVGSDLAGDFELFVKQGNCPSTISHKDVAPLKSGAFQIPHSSIFQNGAACTSDSVLGIVNKNVLETTGAIEALLREKNISPVIAELNKQKSWFLVGSEQKKRECGGSSIAANSIFIFVEENRRIRVPGLINLFPGAKYMIVYEPNSPVPCTYFSKTSARPIGAPSTSPISSPSAAAPADAVPAPVGTSSSSDKDPDAAAGTTNPSLEPEADAEADGKSVCFPADATVTLQNGQSKRMEDIQIGDRVQVAPAQFSDIFMFTHRDARVRATFVDITTDTGANLQLTPAHYMYINGRLAAASTVRQGDILKLANGHATRVTKVSSVIKNGVFNPQTVQGDIVVNGVVASTYTQTVAPSAAHSLLAPMRALFRAIGFSTAIIDNRSEGLASAAPKGAAAF